MRRFLAALAVAAAVAGGAQARTFTVVSQTPGLPSAEAPNASGSTALSVALLVPPAVPEVRSYPQLLDLWQRAGAAYGVPWQVLAAINKIESNFGRNMGPSSAGAIGWMQFMPATWERWGTDANGDGLANPWNPDDAVFSAARYLAAAGASTDLYRAIYAYNHADWYVQEVVDLAGSAASSWMLFPLPSGASWTRGGGPEEHRAGGRGDNWESLNAVDIMTEPGTPVLAVLDGVVERVSAYEPAHQSGNGAVVSGASITLRAAGTTIFYTHLDGVTVTEGQTVAAGEIIAHVADGTPGGAHLHFAVEPPGNPEAVYGDGFASPLVTGGFAAQRVFSRADLPQQLAAAQREVRRASRALAAAEADVEQLEWASLAAERDAGDPELSDAGFRALEGRIGNLGQDETSARARVERRRGALEDAVRNLRALRREASTISFTQAFSGGVLAGTQPSGGYVFPVGGGPALVSVSHTHHDYPAADIAAPEGAPVYALASATVLDSWATPAGRCGIGLELLTFDGVQYTYCHLSYLDPSAVPGAVLGAGAPVGVVGSTGHATGPHLHLQLSPPDHYPQDEPWFQSFAGSAFSWQDAPTATHVFAVESGEDTVITFTR